MSANRALKDPSEEPEIDQLSETVDIVTSYVFGMYDSSMNTHLHPRIESDWSPSKQDEVKFSFYAQSELQVPFCTGTETVITVVFLWHWIIWTVYSNSHKNYIKLLSLLQMNKKKCPLLERVCPLFKHFAQLGCRWLRGSSFCPLSSSGQEKGCFGVELGVFCVCTYLQMGVCDGLVKNRGWWKKEKKKGKERKERKKREKTALLPFYMWGGVCKSLQHRRSLLCSTSPSGVWVIICVMKRSDEVQCCCMTQIPNAHR